MAEFIQTPEDHQPHLEEGTEVISESFSGIHLVEIKREDGTEAYAATVCDTTIEAENVGRLVERYGQVMQAQAGNTPAIEEETTEAEERCQVSLGDQDE